MVRSDAKRRRPRRTTPARRRTASNAVSARAMLPYFLSFCILICLGVIFFLGYQSVTASDFFDVRSVEIRGTERASKENIERIVLSETEKAGAWDADLDEIRSKIEKLQFVKTAAVSRVLPDGIRVVVEEKIPVALVETKSGVVVVDETGAELAAANETETEMSIVLKGWDEERSPKADAENLKRLERYAEMVDQFAMLNVDERVKAIDLSDLREPRASAEDSGQTVTISLGRENFGENFKRGLEAIAGKGETFEGIDLFGSNMRLVPRKK